MNDEEILSLFEKTMCFATGDTRRYAIAFDKEREMLDYIAQYLPSFEFFVEQIINYITSNDLTTGDEAQDKVLDNFVFSENLMSATNKSVLIKAIREALVYNRSGIRWMSDVDGLVMYSSDSYAKVYDNPKKRIKRTIGYIVSDEDAPITSVDYEHLNFDTENEDGSLTDSTRNVTLVPNENFVELSLFTSKENVLLKQKFQVELLLSVLRRMNFDVPYDGPGRLVIKVDEKAVIQDMNKESNSEMKNVQDAAKRTLEQGRALAREIKSSGSDNVILLNKKFADWEHLPRTNKVTEFFPILDKQDEMVARLFTVPPTPFGAGEMSGNISQEVIHDNFMLNSVVPWRERIAQQVSSLISPKLKLDKVYFDKYEMRQSQQDNERTTANLSMAVSRLIAAGENEKAEEIMERM